LQPLKPLRAFFSFFFSRDVLTVYRLVQKKSGHGAWVLPREVVTWERGDLGLVSVHLLANLTS